MRGCRRNSAAEIRSPGRHMRHMNPPGDPRSYHRWSVWQPMDSLGFAENVSEWKWRDDATDALISNVHCAIVKWGPCLVHFDHLFTGCMVSADYWLADYPEPRRTTQPSTIGGPLGEPGICIFYSTEEDCHTFMTNHVCKMHIELNSSDLNFHGKSPRMFQFHVAWCR